MTVITSYHWEHVTTFFDTLHYVTKVLKKGVKNKELRLSHSAYGDAFITPFFLHSHINQYGRLFTLGPLLTSSLLKSVRGDNLHALTVLPPFLLISVGHKFCKRK